MLGALVIVGFFGGAALATSVVGILLLWIAVLAGLGWLAIACAHTYTWTPHPVIAQRERAVG